MPVAKRQPLRSKSVRKNTPSHKLDSNKTQARKPAQRKRSTGGGGSHVREKIFILPKLSTNRKLDIIGVVLVLLGLLTLLSLLSSNNGTLTGWLIVSIQKIAGMGSFIIPFILIFSGVWLVLRNTERLPTLSIEKISGLLLLYLNILAWIHLAMSKQVNGWELADAGQGGGYLGAISERLMVGALGRPGAIIVFSAWSLIATALTFDISVSEIFTAIQKALAAISRWAQSRLASGEQNAKPTFSPSNTGKEQGLNSLPRDFKPINSGTVLDAKAPDSSALGDVRPSTQQHVPQFPEQAGKRSSETLGMRSGKAAGTAVSGQIPSSRRTHSPASASDSLTPLPPWELPSIDDILDNPEQATIKTNQDGERGRIIEETLASFGAPVRVVATNHGPVVTQFGVEPLFIETRNGQTRVRVSKIVALADDLALALAAPRIRIQAPVPGRNYVGIEVPNLEVSRVLLRDVIESEVFRKIKSPLRFALGKDVAGHPKVYDLAGMPHLLIAGTTGSGKSVLVNAILSCFLLNNTPVDLRMILVDPKRVELTGYNGVPHLLAPVVVEAEEVVGALQWVQREMDARYHRFSQVGSRNILDYNSHHSPPLPYLLVLIDELADLMMLAPDETERSLTRLAQLARATGIHLVLATQRPSVDVVTGLIKANFPARVAFAVASGTDSRVILDQPGAERLLGRGDMLFQAPDAASPVRLQGVYVSEYEIQRLVEFWRLQAFNLRDLNIHQATAMPVNMDVPLNTPLKQTPLWGESENGKPGDPVLPEAIKIVREEGKASISMLQRKLRIGYTRAARLIDQLEEMGIIGPSIPTSQVREVLDKGNDAEVENQL